LGKKILLCSQTLCFGPLQKFLCNFHHNCKFGSWEYVAQGDNVCLLVVSSSQSHLTSECTGLADSKPEGGATIAMVHYCHHIPCSAPFQLSLPPSDHSASNFNAFYGFLTMSSNGQVATDGWNGQDDFFLLFTAIFGSLKLMTDTHSQFNEQLIPSLE
jgi:hypothetical protein